MLSMDNSLIAQGDITVSGMYNKSVEAKRVLGYVPEIPSLYPNLTTFCEFL